MSAIDLFASRLYPGSGDSSAPLIYVVDRPEHRFDLAACAPGLTSNLLALPVNNWNDALTPWPAEGLYRGEPDFGGKAPETLFELQHEVIPSAEAKHGLAPRARAICGYSLGGLFSLYAFTHCNAFSACACLSGSVWYEGWVEHLESLDLQLEGKYAFLSVGTKEKRAARPILKGVQDNMESCTRILEGRGCEVSYVVGPGNHMQHVAERFFAGLQALDVRLR